MNRRDFLTLAGFAALFPSGLIFPKKKQLFGWKPGHRSRLPPFGKRAKHLKYFGEGKVACLWKPYNEIVGREWLGHDQEIGDCVAHAAGSGMDFLTTKQIAMGRNEQWIAPSSTDAIYSGGRNLIAQRKVSVGMWGEWAVEYLNKYGNLLRINYPPYDLAPYSRETAYFWDRKALPESLLEEAKEHPLLDYAPTNNADDARDAISAGYPVLMCSWLGLNNSRRDSEGFVKPRGNWSHGMLLIGVDTEYRRPGFCIINSHGANWADGPTRHGQPAGSSVWVDYKVINHYLNDDCYALSNYRGFPKPDNDYVLW
jgi:hypothetical protein